MIRIGRVSVCLEKREVYRDDLPVPVGSRAFDLLELLIRERGRTVMKHEILRHVWPDSIVEENNIHVQLSTLRKIFGEDKQAIRTISGRGYRLALPHEARGTAQAFEPAHAARTDRRRLVGLPVRHARLIGRERAIVDVTRALGEAPVVTLLGPGGIGKTQLGIAVAGAIAAASDVEVCFVALASVEHAQSVVGALAEALGVEHVTDDASLNALVAALEGRELLFLLDNCEHVIESAACVCERLVQAGAHIRVLATSREPLRTRHETLYWVAPLETPDEDASSQSVLACSSVRLLLAQLDALDAGGTSERGSIEMIATVCRRLDGVPLALELAAARASVFGMRRLVAELDDRFRSLTGGRRTAPPRHRTLAAALDWSYRLLSETERLVLQRLSVLPARFALDDACGAASCERLSPGDVTEAIAGLASKCLVMSTSNSRIKEYFLLETTREYALRKLHESDEHTLLNSN